MQNGRWSGEKPLALVATIVLSIGVIFVHSKYFLPMLLQAHLSQKMSTLGYCLKNRGFDGNWYYHPSMGKRTFYLAGYRASAWYKKKSGNNMTSEVYPGNMWAWNDTTDALCGPIRPVTKDSFCNAMEQLAIRRILFVGDSLMGAQMNSLLHLLGYKASDFSPTQQPRKRIYKPALRDSIECTRISSSGQNVTSIIFVQFHRENLGPNLIQTNIVGREDASRKHRQQFGPEMKYCTGKEQSSTMEENYYCPWHIAYNSTQIKTVLILNQGAHFHSIGSFSRSMDQFVSLFNTLAHPNDIVIFRSTVPGHKDCFNGNSSISPANMTFDKFLERYSTTQYDWNLFDRYNAIARKWLEKIQGGVKTHYLNVYNMTVLRSDQHSGATDCLHYNQPGPIDYWNHLLVTNLADATLEWDHLHRHHYRYW